MIEKKRDSTITKLRTFDSLNARRNNSSISHNKSSCLRCFEEAPVFVLDIFILEKRGKQKTITISTTKKSMSNLFKFAENILNNLDHSTQSSINGSGLSKTSSGSSLGGERKNSTPTLNDTLMHAIKHTTKSKSGKWHNLCLNLPFEQAPSTFDFPHLLSPVTIAFQEF